MNSLVSLKNSTKTRLRLLACAVAAALPASLAGLALQPSEALAQYGAPARQPINLPNLGDDSTEAISPAMERKIGEQIMRDIRRDRDFLNDAELTDYVTQLGARLVNAIPVGTVETRPDIEYFVLQDASINAFALLGGYIGVHSGLLLSAETEAEAASVMAHEIGHLTQKHLSRGLAKSQRNSALTLAALAGAILAAKSNPGVSEGLLVGAEAAQLQAALNNSRDFEREADRVGFQTLEAAGFDSAGMAAFFQRLARNTRVYDSNAPAYLRSHPMTEERIADMQSRVRQGRYRQNSDSLDFQLARAKLRALAVQTAQGLRDAETDFQQRLRERANDPKVSAILRFGLTHVYLLQRNAAAAQTTFKQIPPTIWSSMPGGGSPMVVGLSARVAQVNSDVPSALAMLKAGISRFPESRALVYGLIETYQVANQHTEAAALLRDRLSLYRQDAKLHELNAKTQTALGKRAAGNRALAEAYAINGALPAAIEQLQIAKRAGDGDFYELSIIDARLCELQAKSLQEKEEERAAGILSGRSRAPERSRGSGCS